MSYSPVRPHMSSVGGSRPATRRSVAALLMAALLVAVMGSAALAQQTEGDDTNVTVSSGTLNMDTLDSIGNFADVTIDGTAQSTSATMQDFNVRDFRGTGDGWNVTAQATQFAEHDGTAYVTDGATLAADSLTLVEPTVAAEGDTTSPPPTITAGPYTIDGDAAVQFASAASNEGMGEYSFTFGADSLALAIPSDVIAATYRSDVTIDLVSGP